MADSLIFPVGHYGGRFFPDVGQPLRYHQIRVGRQNQKLTDDDEFTVWAIGHGNAETATGADGAPAAWSRADVMAEAERGGLAGAGDIAERLLQRRLLIEVTPGREREFAAAYRLQPLLSGLGNSAEDLLCYRLGLAGFEPLLTVGRVAAELWQFGPDCPNLWTACELLARVAGETGETEPAYLSAERVLDSALAGVRVLLVHSAVYLDVA